MKLSKKEMEALEPVIERMTVLVAEAKELLKKDAKSKLI